MPAQWMGGDPIASQKKMPSDELPRRVMQLLLELLGSDELANDDELLIGGAWQCVGRCLSGRPSVASTALECGIFELAVTHLKAIGSPADWLSISRGKAGRGGQVVMCLLNVLRAFGGHAARPDLSACVSSGLIDLSVVALAAFAGAGVDGLGDTDHIALVAALACLRNCRAEAGCDTQIRSVAPALAFCLDNNLDFMEEIGASSQGSAATVCCAVFGRDEGGSEFTFSQHHIDTLVTRWSQTVRAVGFYKTQNPSADDMMALELCISDENKPLLLANESFIPYLVGALLVDPGHPRAAMKEDLRVWCQQHHAECLAQLAVFQPARATLLQAPSVLPALEAVAETGLSAEAREFAAAALLALSDKKLEKATEGQMHIMLSYQWDAQATMKRINASLLDRGFVTWFDLTDMKGERLCHSFHSLHLQLCVPLVC